MLLPRHLLCHSTRTGAAAFLALAAPAVAQSLAPTAAADQNEIVITAQRREQRLQDVGIAVTALSGDTLGKLNIQSGADLAKTIPSLKMNAYSSSAVVYNIRGISQNDFGDQQEPPVAVYHDDSYASSINFSSFPVFDLARVEVLRGPQGTLFGRNATGGAVQLISNLPTRTWEGYLTGTVGRYGQIITEGAVSGPLAENMQVRISGIRNRDKGYIDNINPGFPNMGANNHWALRGILAWQPADAIDTRLTLRYVKANERQAGAYTLGAACPNEQFQGEFLGSDQSCDYWGTGPGQTGTGYRNDEIMPQFGGSPWKTGTDEQNFVNRKVFAATFRMEADLGSDVSLISISDYQHGRKYLRNDEDASPDPATTFAQGSRVDQGSQEFRLLAKVGAHQLTFGAYGLIIDGDYTGSFADPFYDYLPQVAFSQRTRSFAFFAQDEWSFADKLKLIGGVRYWNDNRRGAYFGTEASTGVDLVFNRQQVSYSSFGVVQPADGLLVRPSDATPTYDGIAGRIELDYKPVEDVLVYASYNRGSKSGGFTFSTGTPFPGAEISALNGIGYRPEKLDAFEIGAKTRIAPGTTLNISAFHYRYSDYQAFAQYGSVQTVINLDARAKGVEIDLSSRPFDGLTLQIGASFLDTKVLDVPLPDGVSIVQHDLPQSPGFSGNALARYEFAVGPGKASIQGDYQHSDKFCFTVLCAPVEAERGYDVVNARLGFAPDSEAWEIAAFVSNIFSEKYRSYAFDESLFGGNVAQVYARPRVWGVTGTVRFGQ